METIVNPFDEYMTPCELAKSLKRSTRTLDRWHVMGIGPARTVVGRLILYRRSSVAQWLLQRETRRGRR